MIRNNKLLYESILKNVSKIIKKHLNEDLMDDLYDINQKDDVTIDVADKIYDEPLEKLLAKLIAQYLNIKNFYLSSKDYNGNICLNIAGKNENHQPFSQELELLYDKCCLLCKKYKDNYSGEWCRKLGEFQISITKTFNIVISFKYVLKYYCSFRILKRINTPCNNKYELLNYFENKFLK